MHSRSGPASSADMQQRLHLAPEATSVPPPRSNSSPRTGGLRRQRRLFLDSAVTGQEARVGQCPIASVEDSKLHVLVRLEVADDLNAHCLPRWPSVDENILQNRL